MRFNDEYRALMAKIVAKKEAYAEKEMFVSTDLEKKIQKAVEGIKKNRIRIVVGSALLMVIIGYSFDFLRKLSAKWIMWVVLGCSLAIFLGLIIGELYFKFKLRKMMKKKAASEKEKQVVRDDIHSLNSQIASLVVSTVILNEHFYELESLSHDERIVKWKEYVARFLKAFDYKYFSHQTYTEYQEYFQKYYALVTSLEENNEGK